MAPLAPLATPMIVSPLCSVENLIDIAQPLN